MRHTETLGSKTKYISGMYKQAVDRATCSYGLTFSQCHVLGFLSANAGKNICNRDIEEAFGLRHSTVNGLITRLLEKGFVDVSSSENDKRYKYIKLTDKALQLDNLVRSSLDNVDNAIMNCLSEEEQSELMRLLDKIIDNIPHCSCTHRS